MPALYFRRARLRPFAAVAVAVALALLAAGPALARPAGPTAAQGTADSLHADRAPASATPEVDATGLWGILGVLAAAGLIVAGTRLIVSRRPASAAAPTPRERPLDTTSATG